MILAAIILAAAPSFITPEMTYRNGLTDAQYEYLWKQGSQPSIDQQTARDWMFKSFRYANTTNWFNILGATNNFAALSYSLQNENFALEEENAVLTSSNSVLRAGLNRMTRKYESVSNMLEVTEAQLVVANAKIESEKAWLTNTAVQVKENADVCRDKDVGNWLAFELLPAISNRIDVLNLLSNQ